jgi:hypothetical protein
VRRVRRSVYCTASFSVCSRRRTELPIIYADFRLDYKLATLPTQRSEKPDTARRHFLHIFKQNLFFITMLVHI